MTRMAGDALTGKYSGEDEYGKWGDTWDTKAHQQQLKAKGSYDKESELGKLYGGLKENISSRVDDETGWRQLDIDGKLRDPKAYQDLVEKYSAAGFDVRAIDMDDKYHSSNIAIRPGDFVPTGDGGGGTDPVDAGAGIVVTNNSGPQISGTALADMLSGITPMIPVAGSSPNQQYVSQTQSFDRTFGDNENRMGDKNVIYGSLNQGNQDNSLNFGYQGAY